MGDRRGIAFALQFNFHIVDRPRRVLQEDQIEIDPFLYR